MINQKRFFTKVLLAFLIIATLMSNSSTQVIASSVTEPSQNNLNKDYDASIKEFDEVYKIENEKWKQNNPQAELVTDMKDDFQDDKQDIFSEVLDKRDINVKHFFNGSSYEAVVYPYPVHYKENGRWVDIDNSLIESVDDEDLTANDPQNSNKVQPKVFKVKQNDFSLKLAKKASAKNLIHIKKDNYSLSWNIESANNSAIEIENSNTLHSALSQKDKKKVLKDISSTTVYRDALPNIDLQYVVLPTEVKENFILKDYTQNLTINMHLKSKGLKAKLLEDNSIIFYDDSTSETIFTIPTPYMYDDNDAISYDIDVNLIEDKNNTYKLSLTPNDTWLSHPDRKYPIVLDPTTQTNQGAQYIYDAHVSENEPTTNFQIFDRLKVGKGSISGLNKAYIKFDLPSLPSGATIDQATLDMYTMNENVPERVDVHRVTSGWTVGTITWDNQPYIDTLIKSSKDIQVMGKQSWLVSNTVQRWYNDQRYNYGLVLKTTSDTGKYTEFYSSDNGVTSYRPQLTIRYNENDPLPPALGTFYFDAPSELGIGKFKITASIANAHHIAVKIIRPDNVVEWYQQNSASFSLEYTPTMTGAYKLSAHARNTESGEQTGTETKITSTKTVQVLPTAPLGEMSFELPYKGVLNEAITINSSWENAHHLAVKITNPDGVDSWFVKDGTSYSLDYTPTKTGIYGITLYARNTETSADPGTEAKQSITKNVKIYDSWSVVENYAYSIGLNYKDGDIWLLGLNRVDTRQDAINAAENYYMIPNYNSHYNTSPTWSYISGNNPNTLNPRIQSEIFFISGHGAEGRIHVKNLNKSDSENEFYITTNYDRAPGLLNSLQLVDYDLSNVKLMTFASCKSADVYASKQYKSGIPNTLVDVAVDMGAATAVGWTGSVSAVWHPTWLSYYNFGLRKSNYTVKQAVDLANSFTYGDDSVLNNVIKGDENLLLNPSNSSQNIVTNVINSDTNNVGKQDFEERYNVVQQIDEKISGIIFEDNVNSTINITDLSNDNLYNLALTLFNMDINTFEHQIEQSTAINNYSRYAITLKKDGFKTNKSMVFNVRNDKISSIYSTINETIIQDMKNKQLANLRLFSKDSLIDNLLSQYASYGTIDTIIDKIYFDYEKDVLVYVITFTINHENGSTKHSHVFNALTGTEF